MELPNHGIDPVGSKNASDTRINPATEDTLSSLLSRLLAASTSIGVGSGTVTTAGTAVQLPSTAVRRVVITCSESNANGICIGGSAVVAAVGTRKGRFLYPTQSEVFYVTNLNLLYIDSVDNGAAYHYYYEV